MGRLAPSHLYIWPFQPSRQPLQSLFSHILGGGEATDRPGRRSALPTEPRSASDSPLPPRHAPARRRGYLHRPLKTPSSTLTPRPRSAKGFSRVLVRISAPFRRVSFESRFQIPELGPHRRRPRPPSQDELRGVQDDALAHRHRLLRRRLHYPLPC